MSDSIKKGFLSLKWQAVLIVSSILIFGVGLITYFGKKNLEQTYVNQRDRVFQDRRQAVTGALQAMQLQLLHLANHMQALAGRSDTSAGNRWTLRETLDINWDHLNFEWSVDAAALFNAQGAKIAAWGIPFSNAVLSAENTLPDQGSFASLAEKTLAPVMESAFPADWVMEAHQLETPVTKLWCGYSCWQIVIVPVFLDERSVGMLSLAHSLADVVLQFHNTTAADVGILVPHTEKMPHSMDRTRSLENWQRDVVALTGTPATYDMLKQLSSAASIANLENARVVQLWNEKHYEISMVPMADSLSGAGASLVLLDDVSTELQRLQSTLSRFIFAAVAILLLAEAVLLWLLWQPMVKLLVVAQALPMLVRNSRGGVRVPLDPPGPVRFVRNEIHDLFDAAHELSRTLEQLYAEVISRTRGLRKRSRELLLERNFVTTLLNNVHVVILTQDSQGCIRLLNSEGRRLIGLGRGDLKKIRFADYLEQVSCAEIEKGIRELFTTDVRQFHHESDFICGADKRLYMEWYHSHLHHSDAKEDLVLSVGLDLTARKSAEKNLAWLADHDPLTRLYNRRHFQYEFGQALKKHQRFQQSGALLFFDVDQFKAVNDTCGHPVGDRLLCELAQKLSREIRDTDTLARLGGDEFAILLEQTDREGAISLAEKLCGLTNRAEVVVSAIAHRITISVGIALFPEHGETMEELMANADFAMYRAKAEGSARSNWCLYSAAASVRQELQNHVDWKARIESALDHRRLLLYYQPILDIRANRISHYEALVRMRDEQGEIVPPAMFIPIAEKTGLIHEVDRYVMNLAVADLRAFCEQGRDITLSINLSAKAIAKSHFIASIEDLVEEHAVDRSRLIFELTETSAVEDIAMATDVIGQCRDLGYQFALDDFGVGFASWFYLRQLPVDYVKIDGSFVRNLSSSGEDRLFVKAINYVAQGLGKKTIAEFVEDAPALALSSDFGVDYAQGYYIGKPGPELLPGDTEIPVFPFTGSRGQTLGRYPTAPL